MTPEELEQTIVQLQQQVASLQQQIDDTKQQQKVYNNWLLRGIRDLYGFVYNQAGASTPCFYEIGRGTAPIPM